MCGDRQKYALRLLTRPFLQRLTTQEARESRSHEVAFIKYPNAASRLHVSISHRELRRYF